MEERRKFFRVKLRKLTSLVLHEGAYELIEEDAKSTSAKVDVKDISAGGLSLKSKCEFPKDAFLELTMPKIKTLDSAVVKCEVTRAEFEDGNYEYAVGLKFIPTNTNYLKQFVEAIKAQWLALTGILMTILNIFLATKRAGTYEYQATNA